MSDYILIEGDKAQFLPNFGAALAVVQPGELSGSGPATLEGTKLCVEGDESSVEVSGVVYMTPVYSIPGTGTLKIDSLGNDQVAEKTKTGDTAVLLVGSTFTAKLEVQSPAQQPPPGTAPPVPDATTEYSGTGMFLTTNTKFKGT